MFEHYFPGYSWEGEWTEYDRPDRDAKADITLRHLLTMQSGLECNEWDLPLTSYFNDLNRHYRSRRPFEYVLKRNLINEPGSAFSYNTASTNLVGEIVHRATDQPFAEYAMRNLFEPLGIVDAAWLTWEGVDPGIVPTGGGLYLAPRDVLKIGQLVMQLGEWQGTQVVSEEWIAQSTRPSANVMDEAEYGFLWWRMEQTHPETGVVLHPIVAGGSGGQWLFVYPEQRLVVVTTGGNFGAESDTTFEWLNDYVVPAIRPLGL